MSNFIDGLKNDHALILAMLKDLDAAGYDSPDAGQKLLSIQSTLLAHLAKEDTALYPVMKQAAENNLELSARVDTFALEMKDITQTISRFLSEHMNGNPNPIFSLSYDQVSALLWDRIWREENILFPEYEKLPSQDA